MMKASARAPSNLALVKYWGKRDPELNLPYNSSLSVTLADLHAHTTVEFGVPEDEFWLDEEPARGDVHRRFLSHLDLIREESGVDLRAKVSSRNNFPTAAGLASSAAGFSAMTLACATALDLGWDRRKMSQIAKRASGSAARSFHGGFVVWNRGERADGSDCYAEPFLPKDYWPEFSIIATIVSDRRKPISSNAGMERTVETCPLYDGWVRASQDDFAGMKEALSARDMGQVGQIAEYNAMRLHAVMETTEPPIIYSTPLTHEVREFVRETRDEGLECYFTQDAGPNLKILCLDSDKEEIRGRIRKEFGIETILTEPGQGADIVEEHLF